MQLGESVDTNWRFEVGVGVPITSLSLLRHPIHLHFLRRTTEQVSSTQFQIKESSTVLRIRLRRVGAKKQAVYRLVIAENEWPRDGRFLEIVGQYNPRTNPALIEVDEDRVLHWLSNGARPTESVGQLLTKVGTLDRFTRLKKGESREALVAEAQAAAETLKSSGTRRTRSDKVEPSKKNKQKAEVAAA